MKKRMKRTIRRTLWTAATLGVMVLPSSVHGAAEEAEEAPAGRAAFLAHKCNMCHSIEGAEIAATAKSQALRAVDLGGWTTDDLEAAARFVRKQSEGDEKPHKKEFKGSDEDLMAIFEWLGTVPLAPVPAAEAEATDD